MTAPRIAGQIVEGIVAAPESKTTTPVTTTLPENAPDEIYKYFDIKPLEATHEERNDLQELYGWAVNNGMTLGDALLALRGLERRLGAPAVNERRYSKMLNWIRIDGHIQELQKRREALSDDLRR